MKKLLVLLLACSMLVSSCGNASSSSFNKEESTQEISNQESSSVEVSTEVSSEESTEETTEASAEVQYPVTVVDQLGREVVIEKEPETLVSGYYISTSLLIALGEKANLVGIEAKANKRPIYKLSAPELIELPNVGTAKEFNLEGCAALKPDLVIVPAKLKNVIPSLEDLGMTVIAVNPEDQTLLEEAIVLLGTATNTMERANELLAFTETKLAEVSEVLKDVEVPTVYMASNSSLLSTAAPAMYQNSIIVNAGGENVAKDLTDTYWAEVSYEQVLTWNPAYIIIAAEADYTVEDVLADEALVGCDAITNNNVYQFPTDIEAWDSPVPAGVLGNLWLASVLHPEQYSVEDYESTVTEFYETFYGFTPVLK